MTDAITMDVEVKKYTAKSGAPFPAAKAQEVGESLEEIQMKYGKLRPKLVMQEAEDDQHKLHPYFDWEDEKAARNWRLQQARMIINHVEVEIITADAEPQKIRAYCSIGNTGAEETKDDRSYVDIETVLSNDFYHQQAVEDALQRLVHWKSEYQHLIEFTSVIKEIDALEDELV